MLESYKYDPLGEKYTRLHFTLLSHPMTRYRRYVVNDLLNVIGNLIIIINDYNSIYLNHISLFDKFVKKMKIIYSKLNIYASFFYNISFIKAIIIIKQIVLPALMKKRCKVTFKSLDKNLTNYIFYSDSIYR